MSQQTKPEVPVQTFPSEQDPLLLTGMHMCAGLWWAGAAEEASLPCVVTAEPRSSLLPQASGFL